MGYVKEDKRINYVMISIIDAYYNISLTILKLTILELKYISINELNILNPC